MKGGRERGREGGREEGRKGGREQGIGEGCVVNESYMYIKHNLHTPVHINDYHYLYTCSLSSISSLALGYFCLNMLLLASWSRRISLGERFGLSAREEGEGGKEGRSGGGKEGRSKGGKEGRREEGRKVGGKEGRRVGGKEGMREGR